MSQQSLDFFDTEEPSLRETLGPKLRSLAAEGLFLGGSSWKYEGWLGSVYSPERYRVNGRFSKKLFEQECLREYAETFSTVSGDFAFYQFPQASFWRRLFEQVPPPFQWTFKAPEDITLPVFPQMPRYGAHAGLLNRGFLNAGLFRSQFLDLLRPYKDRVAVILFEFGAAIQKRFTTAADFANALDRFFGKLPRDFRFAVEIRNPIFLDEAYFAVLNRYGVAHVFNAWTAMPEIHEQMSLPESFSTDFTVARGILRVGREHAESVSLFAPYSEMREPNHAVRAALRNLLQRSRTRREPTFIYLNNRLEGFAPATIASLTDGL